jgi:hypothetical protein
VLAALKAGKGVNVDFVTVSYDQDGKPIAGSRKTIDHRPCPAPPN